MPEEPIQGTSGVGDEPPARPGEVVLPGGPDLGATVDYFVAELGFRLVSLRPAEAPAVVVLAGHGLRLRLDRSAEAAAGRLRLPAADTRPSATAPNGTRIEWYGDAGEAPAPLRASLVVSRCSGAGEWLVGRAGMLYRDLLPDRWGGRYVASHIRIPAGGPVPDYVHFHRVGFQLIYCLQGWVEVAYQDQGAPLRMAAGDCVLQPPGIRHRVLRCSPGLEVLEVGSPADHETVADPATGLPGPVGRPERRFAGQRFCWHRVATAAWTAAVGYRQRSTGLADASAGAVDVRVWQVGGTVAGRTDAELTFAFVCQGTVQLQRPDGVVEILEAGDGAALPMGTAYSLAGGGGDAELVWITAPAAGGIAGC